MNETSRRIRILVLVKQVPDPKFYVGMKEDGTLDRQKADSVINACDMNALAAALKIKSDCDAKITVVSMGPPQAKDALRQILALGADEAFLLSDRKLAGSDTLATSYALSCAVRKIGPCDLILCGMEASDGNTGQVGPEVAERLGIPQVTYVDAFDVKGHHVEARRMLEGGHEILRVKLPALLTITNTAGEYANRALGSIVEAEKESLTVWSASDVGVDEGRVGLQGSPTKIRKIERPIFQRSMQMVEGYTTDEALENLLGKLSEEGIGLGEVNG